MITLHVDLGRQWRGGQSQALLLMKGLQARGHVAQLVTLRGSPLALRAEAEGIHVHKVGATACRLRAASRISNLVAEMNADVIHAHEAHAVTAIWLARIGGRATAVASRRLAYPLGRSWASQAKYRGAARILAVSRFVAGTVEASGIPGRQVAVVYDGVEIPAPVSGDDRLRARRRWGVEGNRPLLGCVGYLLPEKNQELLIRAWPAVRKASDTSRMLIAGDGPCRRCLEKLALELGVKDSIHFAGHVENIAEVYAALDVFLFPSHAEPLGSSMLAALAYGLPTVAVAGGAVPEVIEDGQNGLLASGPDPAEFASVVGRILHDDGLAKRLGKAGRGTIHQRFAADRMVEETLRVYEQACRERVETGGMSR
jgi:L-malate glycosyltransferase